MRLLSLLLCLTLIGCSEVNTSDDSSTRSPTNPSPTPTPVRQVKIEFRVTGNPLQARIRLSNAIDGLSQVTTTLPFVSTISTTEESMFLSLEATPSGYASGSVFPFLSVQIFADGKLFREDNSNDFTLNTLTVSGTWRRSS